MTLVMPIVVLVLTLVLCFVSSTAYKQHKIRSAYCRERINLKYIGESMSRRSLNYYIELLKRRDRSLDFFK